MVAKKAEKLRKEFDNKFGPGFPLIDIIKQQWQLGDLIGRGGFGNVYAVNPVGNNLLLQNNLSEYSAKIEPFSNGPLFTEIAFYQRVATKEKINAWCDKKKLKFLGLPTYIASGSSDKTSAEHRFIILPRLGENVERIWLNQKKNFSVATVYQLGIRMLECLEYIHHHGYSHGDIKTSNLMTGYLDSLADTKIYLMDFGLATSFSTSAGHKIYKEDLKRKHDGTIEYTSIDAHMGAIVSRRGDLINLGFVLLHLFLKDLPWLKYLEDKEKVFQEKKSFLNAPQKYLSHTIDEEMLVKLQGLTSFIEIARAMKYDEQPPYEKLINLFKSSHEKYANKTLKDVNNKGHVCILVPESKSPSQIKISLKRHKELDELNTPRRNPGRLAKRTS